LQSAHQADLARVVNVVKGHPEEEPRRGLIFSRHIYVPSNKSKKPKKSKEFKKLKKPSFLALQLFNSSTS